MSILPGSPSQWQHLSWQSELASAVTDVNELLDLLELPANLPERAFDPATPFRLKVPHSFISRMRRGDPNDPLLRQVLPVDAENQVVDGFGNDPVGDLAAESTPGVLHKYQGRALLVTTGACAVHCRYCFRRHFPYPDANPARDNWQQALAYLRADSSINEIILSGGDPLSLTDNRLEALVDQLQDIPHLNRLRIHTRLPIVVPSRVTDPLLSWLTGSRLQPVMVVHVNHANELDNSVSNSLGLLKSAGVTLLNQSVLLKGINDTAEQLAQLSEALFDAGVLPYYLHCLDPVAGAAHFDTEESHSRELQQELSRRLPGYLVPRLVREISGAAAKVPL